MDIGLLFGIGFVCGALFGALIALFSSRRGEKQRHEDDKKLIELLKGKFSELSAEALDKSQKSLVTLAEERYLRKEPSTQQN